MLRIIGNCLNARTGSNGASEPSIENAQAARHGDLVRGACSTTDRFGAITQTYFWGFFRVGLDLLVLIPLFDIRCPQESLMSHDINDVYHILINSIEYPQRIDD